MNGRLVRRLLAFLNEVELMAGQEASGVAPEKGPEYWAMLRRQAEDLIADLSAVADEQEEEWEALSWAIAMAGDWYQKVGTDVARRRIEALRRILKRLEAAMDELGGETHGNA